MCHNRGGGGGVRPAAGLLVSMGRSGEKKDYFLDVITSMFCSLKWGLGPVPFLSFYESGCLKDIWRVCNRLREMGSAGKQWKQRKPTNASRRSPLLAVQRRGLLKNRKKRLLQLQRAFRLYAAHIWLKDHNFIWPLLCCLFLFLKNLNYMFIDFFIYYIYKYINRSIEI